LLASSNGFGEGPPPGDDELLHFDPASSQRTEEESKRDGESSSDTIELADEISGLDLDQCTQYIPKPKKKDKIEEDDHYFQNEWPKHKKHIFILSNSGKPVYSRHGDEQKLCAFMPVLSAISSFVDATGDTIKTIYAGEHKIVFLFKGPLHLVTVSRTAEPASHLARQLDYIHSQIISSLTAGVKKIYETRAHFDIRALLGDSTHLIDSLIDSMEHDMLFLSSCFLNAVFCFPLPAETRKQIGAIMQRFHTGEIVYTLLLARQQLVNVVRLKKHALHSEDFHLIVNFLSNVAAIKQTDSSTSPVCLPRFNDRGYLHFYTTFLVNEVCLILISTKAGNFEDGKNQIQKALEETGAIRIIQQSIESMEKSRFHYGVDDVLAIFPDDIDAKESIKDTYETPISVASSPILSPSLALSSHLSTMFSSASSSFSASPMQHPSLPSFSQLSSPLLTSHPSFFLASTASSAVSPLKASRHLLHFLYKDHRHSQFTCPRLEPPYFNAKEQKRLFRLYQRVHNWVNEPALAETKRDKNSSRVSYYVSTRESMVAWVTAGFELYATFGPLVSKSTSLKICNRILKWIQRKENVLFVSNPPTW